MIPADDARDVQLGFRQNRSASLGCTLLHDMDKYFSDKYSPIYMCTLGVLKSVDIVSHDSLWHKLVNFKCVGLPFL